MELPTPPSESAAAHAQPESPAGRPSPLEPAPAQPTSPAEQSSEPGSAQTQPERTPTELAPTQAESPAPRPVPGSAPAQPETPSTLPESPEPPRTPSIANFPKALTPAGPEVLHCGCVNQGVTHEEKLSHVLTCPAYEQGLALVTETEEEEFRKLLASEDFASVFDQFLCGRRQGKSSDDAYAAAIQYMQSREPKQAVASPLSTADCEQNLKSPEKKRRLIQTTLGTLKTSGPCAETSEEIDTCPLVTVGDVCNSLALYFAFLDQPPAYDTFINRISEAIRQEISVNTDFPSTEGDLLWDESNVFEVREFVRNLPEVEQMIEAQGSFRVEVGDFGLHVCFNRKNVELPCAHHAIMRFITFGVHGAKTKIFDPKASDKLSFVNLGNCVKRMRYGQIFILGSQLNRDASTSFKQNVQHHLYHCGHTSGSLVDLGNGGRMALYGMRGAPPLSGQLQCRPQGVYIYLKPNDMSSILDGPLAKRDGNCAMCNVHRGCGLRKGVPDEAIFIPPAISWDFMFNYFDRVGFPHCDTRKNVMSNGLSFLECFCLGLVNSYSHGPVISQMTVKMNNFTRLITSKFHQDAPYKELETQKHDFTVVQVNRNVKCKLHVDGNNVGPSYICAFGDFTGGETWIYDGVGPVEMVVQETLRGFDFPAGSVIKGSLHDVKNKWVYFNGRVPHCTTPFTGKRYALVYFIHNCTGRLKKEDSTRTLLDSMGFKFPTDGFDFSNVVSDEDLKNFDANPDIEDNQSETPISYPDVDANPDLSENKISPVSGEDERSAMDASDSDVEIVGHRRAPQDVVEISDHVDAKNAGNADENVDTNVEMRGDAE